MAVGGSSLHSVADINSPCGESTSVAGGKRQLTPLIHKYAAGRGAGTVVGRVVATGVVCLEGRVAVRWCRRHPIKHDDRAMLNIASRKAARWDAG